LTGAALAATLSVTAALWTGAAGAALAFLLVPRPGDGPPDDAPPDAVLDAVLDAATGEP
jgi:hypothetical protein